MRLRKCLICRRIFYSVARDRMRMQKFREDKDACSALPFFELDYAQMKEATTIQWDTQPNFVLKSKLQGAAKVIKRLKTSLHCLRTSYNLLH